MTRLSDTQLTILSAASQRPDGNLLPLPGSLRGGAAAKVVTALLARGLATEEITGDLRTADSALNTIWRNTEDGRAILLRITPAGLGALGVEADSASESAAAPEWDGRAGTDVQPAEGTPDAPTAAPTPKTREGTKQAQLIAMLRRVDGATIDEIVAATGWQPHTVRGAFAGALKKRLGLTVTSSKEDGRGRVYRLDC